MIDINFKYAQWSTNVNVMGMNWQTYHEGQWYNPAEKTYDEAVEEIKETIRQKVLKDHPHLIAFEKQDEIINKEKYDQVTKHWNDKFPQSLPKETIEQPKYNLLKEIKKCPGLTMLKALRKMAITDEEIKACDDKMSELTIGSKQEPTY
jgi:hypothetical protein